MKKGELTHIRKVFIIECLLNREKWSTQELIKGVNRLQNEYFEFQDEYYNNSETQTKNVGVNNAKMTPLLQDLLEQDVIDTEPIPKKEKKGRGPGGDRYWLIEDIENYFKTFKMFKINKNRDVSFSLYGIHFIQSAFGKLFLNIDIFSFFESKAKFTLDTEIKKYILEIVKLSPTSLIQLYDFPRTYIPFIKSINKPIYPWENKKGLTHLNYTILKNFLITLTNCFLNDITDLNYPYFAARSPYKTYQPIEVKNIVLIRGPEINNYLIDMNLNELESRKDIKIKKLKFKDTDKIFDRIS